MYIPDDIWSVIKSFLFKTEEMKVYDNALKEMNELFSNTEKIYFINSCEAWLFQNWNMQKKIKYINNI